MHKTSLGRRIHEKKTATKSQTAQPAPPTLRQRRGFFSDHAEAKLDGVVAYLIRECGGNIRLKGIVHVIASSVSCSTGWYQPKNAIDLGTDSKS